MGLWFVRKYSISPHLIPTGNNSGNGKNRWKRVDHCRAEREQRCSHLDWDLAPSPSGSSGHVSHSRNSPVCLSLHTWGIRVIPENHSKLLWRSRTVHKVHVGMHWEMRTAFSEQVFWSWFVITSLKVFPFQILKTSDLLFHSNIKLRCNCNAKKEKKSHSYYHNASRCFSFDLFFF